MSTLVLKMFSLIKHSLCRYGGEKICLAFYQNGGSILILIRTVVQACYTSYRIRGKKVF